MTGAKARFSFAKWRRDAREDPGEQCVMNSVHRRFLRSLPVLLALTGWNLLGADASPRGAKRVEIDKTRQTLRAYEGGRLVLESRVSTGRWDGSTPNGSFEAGIKMRMHYSRRYHHAPMPFSVQVHGHVFIHGFTSVPPWPASHGCIRLPLDGDNPARRFFEWIEPGTPIQISGRWTGGRPP